MFAVPCALLTVVVASSVAVMSCDSPRDPPKPPRPVASIPATLH